MFHKIPIKRLGICPILNFLTKYLFREGAYSRAILIAKNVFFVGDSLDVLYIFIFSTFVIYVFFVYVSLTFL